MKILTVFGTRPEAIKLFPLIHALEARSGVVSRTCSTGQHRELLDQVLSLAGIVPDHDLGLMKAGQSLDALIAGLITGVGRVLDDERPDWVVVQGDTATAMAAGLAAFHRKIPVAHVEAGLRSGNIHHPWPEETNRRIIATFAAIHFAPTLAAAEALLSENIDPATVHVTGNTGIDALQWMRGRIASRPDLVTALSGLKAKIGGRRVIGVTCHRRENFGGGMDGVLEAVRSLAARGDVALVLPLHPNPNAREALRRGLVRTGNVILVPPLDYPNFVHLLDICHFVLTDSGGVQEEAPTLGKPVLVMRETTERPEGIAAGTAKLVGTHPGRIRAEAERLLDDAAAYAEMSRAHSPFGDGQAAHRICDLLQES